MGVCRDMPLTEATSLVRKSSRSTDENRKLTATLLHTEPYDPGADRRKIEELAEWCEKFSPIVGIEPVGKSARGEPEEPESLLLDVTGLGPLFGGEKALLQKMVTEFAQRGYQARAAVADALGTAWGVARFASLNCASQEPPGSISPQAQSDAALTGSTPSAPVPRASDSPLVIRPSWIDGSGATAGLSSSAGNTGGQATRGTPQRSLDDPLVRDSSQFIDPL